jgi:hypothetical protein
MPEDEKPFTDLISWLFAPIVELFLKDRELHFELIDPVFEKEDFLGFGIRVYGSQSFQASPTDPSRESGGQQGGSDEEREGGVENVEALCHGASSNAS